MLVYALKFTFGALLGAIIFCGCAMLVCSLTGVTPEPASLKLMAKTGAAIGAIFIFVVVNN